MKSFTIRVASPAWLSVTVSVIYVGVLIALVVAYFQFFMDLTDGIRGLVVFVAAVLLAPLFGILWLLCPTRVLEIGNGELMLTDGRVQLTRIALSDIAHVQVTEPRRFFQLYDRMGGLRMDLRPYGTANEIDKAVDYLRTQLPHLENQESTQKGQVRFVNRYVDFPPPMAGTPGWRPVPNYQAPSHPGPDFRR